MLSIKKFITAFSLGFNVYLDKKDINFLKKQLLKLYNFNNIDIRKLDNLAKPVNTESMNYIYVYYNSHMSKHISYFFISLIGLFCVVFIVYDLHLSCLNLRYLRVFGLIYITGRIINIIFKLFSSLSRINLILKDNNSILFYLTGFIEKFSFVLGFLFGLFISLIYDILSFMLLLIIFDMSIYNIDSSKSLGIKEKTNEVFDYIINREKKGK